MFPNPSSELDTFAGTRARLRPGETHAAAAAAADALLNCLTKKEQHSRRRHSKYHLCVERLRTAAQSQELGPLQRYTSRAVHEFGCSPPGLRVSTADTKYSSTWFSEKSTLEWAGWLYSVTPNIFCCPGRMLPISFSNGKLLGVTCIPFKRVFVSGNPCPKREAEKHHTSRYLR